MYKEREKRREIHFKFCFKSRFVHYIQISHTRIYSHRFYTTLLYLTWHTTTNILNTNTRKKKSFLIIEAQSFYRRAANGQRTPSRALGRIYVNTRTTFDTAVERHKKENMCVCACFCGFLLLKMVILYQQKAHIYSPTKSATTHSFLELASINAVRARASQAQLFFFQTTVPEG